MSGKRVLSPYGHGTSRTGCDTKHVREMMDTMKRCVANGTKVDDSRVLNVIVCKAGDNVKQFETHDAVTLLTYLVNDLGANINAQDNGGHAPLHCVGNYWNGAVARALVIFGADRNLNFMTGETAFDAWCAKQCSSNDFMHCFGIEGRDSAETNRKMFDDALVIAPDDVRSNLVDSKLSPRMHSLLSEAAAYVHSAALDVASEENSIILLIMSWQNLPETVLDEMSKGRIDRSAALGYVRVLHKISDLLTRKMFPTPMLVRQELMSLDTVQTREKKNVDDYFAIGGLAEHALDAVLSRAKDILEDGAGDDGESEEEESDTYEEEDDTSMSRKRGRDPAEIPAPPRITRSRSVSPVTTLRAAFLPEMYELDENLPLVRNMLLGPSRNGKNAPFAPPQTQEEAEKRMKMVRLRDNAVLQLEKKQKLEKTVADLKAGLEKAEKAIAAKGEELAKDELEGFIVLKKEMEAGLEELEKDLVAMDADSLEKGIVAVDAELAKDETH